MKPTSLTTNKYIYHGFYYFIFLTFKNNRDKDVLDTKVCQFNKTHLMHKIMNLKMFSGPFFSELLSVALFGSLFLCKIFSIAAFWSWVTAVPLTHCLRLLKSLTYMSINRCKIFIVLTVQQHLNSIERQGKPQAQLN